MREAGHQEFEHAQSCVAHRLCISQNFDFQQRHPVYAFGAKRFETRLLKARLRKDETSVPLETYTSFQQSKACLFEEAQDVAHLHGQRSSTHSGARKSVLKTSPPVRAAVMMPGAPDISNEAGGPVDGGMAPLHFQAFDSLPVAMAILDAEATVVSVNAAWRRFGAENDGSADGYVGHNYLNVCRAATDPDADDACSLIAALLSGEQQSGQIEYPCHTPLQQRWFLLQAWRFIVRGSLWVAVMHLDITRRRVAEDTLRESATRDPLTGLMNRVRFQERVEHALARARHKGEPVSLLFIDVNRFKAVNDTAGHEIGDRVLQEVAQRLSRSVREIDSPARIGGDEFAILLEATDGSHAAIMAERITAISRAPIEVDGYSFGRGCSVGMATTLDGQTTTQRLLHEADLAMYEAKKRQH